MLGYRRIAPPTPTGVAAVETVTVEGLTSRLRYGPVAAEGLTSRRRDEPVAIEGLTSRRREGGILRLVVLQRLTFLIQMARILQSQGLP